jgi:hypothetical protein
MFLFCNHVTGPGFAILVAKEFAWNPIKQ